MSSVWLGWIRIFDWTKLVGVFEDENVAKRRVEQERDQGRPWGAWHRHEDGRWESAQFNRLGGSITCIAAPRPIEGADSVQAWQQADHDAKAERIKDKIRQAEATLRELKDQADKLSAKEIGRA